MGKLYAFSIVFCVLMMNAEGRSLVPDSNPNNQALAIGVSHGLPGIHLDVQTAETLAKLYKMEFSSIEEEKATAEGSLGEVKRVASKAAENGSFFLYFSGHGSPGELVMQDRSIKLEELKGALIEARKTVGPLNRFVLMLDSCHAGSFIDPMGYLKTPMQKIWLNQIQTLNLVNRAEQIFAPKRDGYWKELFVFASSTAEETSMAGENGSVFTVEMKRAFDEVVAAKGNMKTWVEKTQTYTADHKPFGHHPVARFVPQSMDQELLLP